MTRGLPGRSLLSRPQLWFRTDTHPLSSRGFRLHQPAAGPNRHAPGPSQRRGQPPVASNAALRPTPFRAEVDFEALEPDQVVGAFIRKHDIHLPMKMMKRIPGIPRPQPMWLSALMSRRHCFDHNALKYLDKLEHPMRKTMLDYYEAKKDQPLWYVTASFGDARPIVHTKATRWMKRGLREALLERGYDIQGRKVASSGQDTSIRDMYGTIKVHCSDAKALCKLEWPGVFALMKKVLVAAEVQLKRDHAGKYTAPPVAENHSNSKTKPSFNYKNDKTKPSFNYTNNKTKLTGESWARGKPASTLAK